MTFIFKSSLFFILFYCLQCFAQTSTNTPFPEQSEIDSVYHGEEPEGIVFLVMEQDEEALYWVLPRVTHYTQQLHSKWKNLPIIILSHGDEMLSLTNDLKSLHKDLHQSIKELSSKYNVLFQVCGSYAFFSDIDASEFPEHIDVVPFAPAEIENYRQMDFKMISLELTW
ncbi:MAG: hypothetical protein KZQ83_11120 [gamma proteobacterium symbiont of Taylorina sp.]|nr:hypothetical protein [gamma proteobacterium symbiont of Taylorina sp.]